MTGEIINLRQYYKENPKPLEEALDTVKKEEFQVSVIESRTGKLVYEGSIVWLGELQDGDILTVSFDLMVTKEK